MNFDDFLKWNLEGLPQIFLTCQKAKKNGNGKTKNGNCSFSAENRDSI